MKIVTRFLALAILFAAVAVPSPAAVFRFPEPTDKGAVGAYARMTEAERLDYVAARAERVARMLAVDGEAPVAVTPDGARAIKARLDRLAARAGSQSNVPGKDDIAAVFARATKAAPVVRRAFEEAGLPPAYGLYIAFIESEYNEGLTSGAGSRGVFQFLPSTAAKYGLAPDDLDDLARSAAAAARYVADRRAEFPGGGAQTLFVLLSYNSGSQYIKTELAPTIEAAGGDAAATFWSMAADPVRYPLSKYFQEEGKGYVTLFFAAAIVGENPADFGLGAKPLSTIR
jgi:soluble lytic murein transglycosylase-like protein